MSKKGGELPHFDAALGGRANDVSRLDSRAASCVALAPFTRHPVVEIVLEEAFHHHATALILLYGFFFFIFLG